MSGGMKLEVEVRAMAPGETSEAALLHERELPHEFLTRFGAGFLSCYYQAFIQSPHAVALVASTTGKGDTESVGGAKAPDGVLIGTFDTKAHYSYLVRRHGMRLALSTLRQAGKSPRLAVELVRTRLLRYLRGIFRSLGYVAGTKKEEVGRDGGRVGFLAYVAVDNGLRGQGIGGRLFEAYEELASEAGLRRLELVTLPDERGAAPFFERMGWEREGEITSRSGERYAFFTRHLDGGEAGS